MPPRDVDLDCVDIAPEVGGLFGGGEELGPKLVTGDEFGVLKGRRLAEGEVEAGIADLGEMVERRGGVVDELGGELEG